MMLIFISSLLVISLVKLSFQRKVVGQTFLKFVRKVFIISGLVPKTIAILIFLKGTFSDQTFSKGLLRKHS